MFIRNFSAIILIFSLFLIASGQDLSQKARSAYANKNFQESARLYVQAFNKGENQTSNAYNAACSYALSGEKDEAFNYLQKAIDLGFTNVNHIKSDSDLKSLHTDPRWQKMLEGVSAKVKATKEFWDSPAVSTSYRENISENEKIIGLSKLWSEVKYNFVNFDLVPDVKWDALYIEYLPKVRETKSTLEYYRVLTELMAKLRDGHSNVYVPVPLRDSVYSRPPMRASLVEDRVIVTDIFADEVTAKGIKVGQEILKIDGVPAKEYAEKYVMPYQSSSTKQDLIKRTYNYFLFSGQKGKPIKLTLSDEKGRVFEAEVQRYNGLEMRKIANRKPTKPFEFKVLENNIGYVSLNTFGTNRAAQDFEKNFDEINKTDALIIDIRRNGGGNSGVGWNILGMLTDKPFKLSKWHTREYRPAYRAWGRQEGKHGNSSAMRRPHKTKHYKKPVVLLTGPATFSAAEDFAVGFDTMDRGLIIGEATGGSTGQPLFFRLPGGGSARVTTKRDSYSNGKEFVGVGIIPDKVVKPTIKDIREGVDTVLEMAKRVVRKE